MFSNLCSSLKGQETNVFFLQPIYWKQDKDKYAQGVLPKKTMLTTAVTKTGIRVTICGFRSRRSYALTAQALQKGLDTSWSSIYGIAIGFYTFH